MPCGARPLDETHGFFHFLKPSLYLWRRSEFGLGVGTIKARRQAWIALRKLTQQRFPAIHKLLYLVILHVSMQVQLHLAKEGL